MERLIDGVVGFSAAREPFDEALFSELVYDSALTLIHLASQKYIGSAIPRSVWESVSQTAAMKAPGCVAACWFPELGLCLRAIRGDDPLSAQIAVAQFALNLAVAQSPIELEMPLLKSATLRWGRFVLPPTESIRVCSDGRYVRIVTTSAGSKRDLNPSLANGEDAGGLIPLVAAGSAPFNAILLSGPDCEGFRLPPPVLPGLERITEAQTKHLRDGLSIFETTCPDWRPWFERVVRFISVAQMPAQGIHSGSFDGYFGLISMSDSVEPLKIAETLVHEAAHQYFFLLNRIVPLAESDGRLFYSPFVGRERPPERLLMAYHAFTNVEMFYRQAIDRGVSPDLCRPALAQLDRELTSVEPALAKDAPLTLVGRRMFEQLAACRSRDGCAD